jgi:hypothetical protein
MRERERVASYGSTCVVRDMYGRDKNEPTETPRATNTRSVCAVSWLLNGRSREVQVVLIFCSGHW